MEEKGEKNKQFERVENLIAKLIQVSSEKPSLGEG